MILISSCATKL